MTISTKKVGQLTNAGSIQAGDTIVGERSGNTVLLNYASVADGDKGDITVSTNGTVWTIDDGAVTYAKLQDVSATDKLLGRSTAGSGDVEEIACTAAGRALLDDATASDQRTTLGLGTLATQSGTFSGTSSGTNTGDQTSIVGITGTKSQFDTAVTDGNFLYVGDVTQYTDEMAQDAVGGMVDSSLTYVDGTPLLQRAALTGDVTASAGSNSTTIANDAVTYAKMQNVSATDKLLGRSTAGSGDVEEIACTAAGRALLDDADAAAQRTTLGLGTLATQSGTFSGTSSGTNTGDQTSIVGITGTKAQFNTAVTDGNIFQSTAFKAYLSSNQTVTSGVITKVQCNTEEYDTGSYYDNATNYRYTPLVQGKYQITVYLEATTNAVNSAIIAFIYKNGSSIARSFSFYNTAAQLYTTASIETSMNGSTDYIEFYAQITSGTTVNTPSAISAFLIEAA